MIAGIAAAFTGGYLMAKVSRSGMQDGSGLQEKTRSGLEVASRLDGGERINRDSSWQKTKARVFERWQASPSVLVDFDLLEETRRLLEKSPVADLEVWMRELRPLRYTDFDKDIPDLLRELILEVLVERGGGEFVRSLAENPLKDGNFDLYELMDHWIRHDPKTVLEWLDGGNLPEEIAEDLVDYKEDSIEELSGKDPVEFERRLATLDAETRESVLENYAYRMGTLEKRAGLLERAARSPHGEAMALYDGLLRREAADDPRIAINTLEELGVSTTDRATLDDRLVSGLMNVSSLNGTLQDKSPVLQSWIERNSERGIPSRILEEFNDWSLVDSERAVAWLAKLDSGFQYDALAMRLVYERTRSDEEDLEEIVGLAARIGDFNTRAEANRRIKKVWKPDEAAKVAEWEQNLPEEDQERLKRDFPDE